MSFYILFSLLYRKRNFPRRTLPRRNFPRPDFSPPEFSPPDFFPAEFSPPDFFPAEFSMAGIFPVSIMCAESVPEEFITYFQSTYIGIFRGRGPNRKRSTPPFPVDMWNVNARVLSPVSIPRSNNSHEAFNKSMTNSIPRIHPNIWLLIRHLKKGRNVSANEEKTLRKKRY